MDRRGLLRRIPALAAAFVALAQRAEPEIERRWIAVESWGSDLGQRMYAEGWRVMDAHYDETLRYAVSYLIQR